MFHSVTYAGYCLLVLCNQELRKSRTEDDWWSSQASQTDFLSCSGYIWRIWIL